MTVDEGHLTQSSYMAFRLARPQVREEKLLFPLVLATQYNLGFVQDKLYNSRILELVCKIMFVALTMNVFIYCSWSVA